MSKKGESVTGTLSGNLKYSEQAVDKYQHVIQRRLWNLFFFKHGGALNVGHGR